MYHLTILNLLPKRNQGVGGNAGHSYPIGWLEGVTTMRNITVTIGFNGR